MCLRVQSVHQHCMDDQSRHHSPRPSQVAGHGVVHGNTGTSGKTSPPSSPVVGRHSLVPEDWQLVRQDHSSSVGTWWSSPAVLQGLPLATRETEVTLFTDVSSSGWGAQVASHSTQGQWSASQRPWLINVLEMQAVINAMRAFLSHLRSRVVRLM